MAAQGSEGRRLHAQAQGQVIDIEPGLPKSHQRCERMAPHQSVQDVDAPLLEMAGRIHGGAESSLASTHDWLCR